MQILLNNSPLRCVLSFVESRLRRRAITTSEPVSSNTLARCDVVARLRARLLRTGSPKNQMLALVSATALLGLLTSRALLYLRLQDMALRYIISVGIAYAGFLGLVRLWILYQQRTWQGTAASSTGPLSARVSARDKPTTKRTTSEGFSWLDWLDSLDIFDDLIVITLLIAGAVSIFFVISHVITLVVLAPDFLAEVLLDGVFSAALYHRLGRFEHQHWMKTVFVKTKAAFLWTLLFFVFLGLISARYAPEAVSIGGVARHLLTK